MDPEHLEGILLTTPAQVVFLLFEAKTRSRHDAFSAADQPHCAYALQDMVKARCQFAVAESNRYYAEWFEGGAVLGHKERVHKPHWLVAVTHSNGFIHVCRVEMQDNYFNVPVSATVGMMHTTLAAVAVGASFSSDEFIGKAARVIQQRGVRFLAGVLSNGKALEQLCKAAGGHSEGQ